MRTTLVNLGALAVVAFLAAAPAYGQFDCGSNGTGTDVDTNGRLWTIRGGQVNFAGATLFYDFFKYPASTNDWIDADADGVQGYYPNAPFAYDPYWQEYVQVDQLARNFNPSPGVEFDSWWAFSYRSVGSVNGFSQFVESELCGVIPTAPPAEGGVFNRLEYAKVGGVINWTGPYANSSGVPIEQCSIDGAFMDVPTTWGTVGSAGAPAWNRKPTESGYGVNPIPSSSGWTSALASIAVDCGNCSVSGTPCVVGSTQTPCPDGETCVSAARGLETLNTNTANPDGSTIYDFPAAWVPVAIISNRGTAAENLRYSDLQYHFATGRLASGENLVAVTRDVGSGTRNAAMNSLGIDPAWGRGDNLGGYTDANAANLLGPSYQPTNKGGSGLVEDAVRHHRLAVGYTGLAGGSRAAKDANGGVYEVSNVCKDVDSNGDAIPGYECAAQACPEVWVDGQLVSAARPNNGYVRPTVNTVLDNADSACGFQIGGSGSFMTVGDALDDGAAYPVSNEAVGDYLQNMFTSIAAFEGNPFAGECSASHACKLLTSQSCTGPDDTSCGANGPCVPKGCTNDSSCTLPGLECTASGTSCTTDADCQPIDINGICQPIDYCKASNNMPGQQLATSFFLLSGIDALHDLLAPNDFSGSDQAPNQALQSFMRASNGLGWGTTPDGSQYVYGSRNAAGKTPVRTSLTGGSTYSDGQTALYVKWNGTQFVTAASGENLAAGNRVQGDFDGDGARDIEDATGLVTAYCTPRAWQQAQAAGTIPEVIGDFNGDGSLTKEDLRYWADGLALSGGHLDRKAGALAIDNAIAALSQAYPWASPQADLLIPPAAPALPSAAYPEPTFQAPPDVNSTGTPFLATGKTYVAGDFRGDVAGSGRNGQPIPGAYPNGWDGFVDAADVDYVRQNIGNWSNLDEAVYMDLSCDMNGDGNVTEADVVELVEVILGTRLGDTDLDGDVDVADWPALADCLTGPEGGVLPGCALANLDGDDDVDLADVAAFAAAFSVP